MTALNHAVAQKIKQKANEVRAVKDLDGVTPFFRDALAEQRAAEASGGAALSTEGHAKPNRKGCLEELAQECKADSEARLSAMLSIGTQGPMSPEQTDLLADKLAGRKPQRAEYVPTPEEIKKMEYLAELSRKCAAQRQPAYIALLDDMIRQYESVLK